MTTIHDKINGTSAKTSVFSVTEVVRKCTGLFFKSPTAKKPDNSAGIAQIDKLIHEARKDKTPEELEKSKRRMKIAKEVMSDRHELLKRLSQT